MISRITAQTIQRSTLANLQTNLSSVSRLQAQLSSGKKVTQPSDDPAHAAQLMSLRGEQNRNIQYERNATDSTSWLTTVDDALQTSSSTLRRARDLIVQGGNSSIPQSSREALASQIEGIRDGLLSTANTSFNGRTVFAGTSAAGVAFDTTTYAWTGNSAGEVARQVSDTTAVRVDSDGSSVFGSGSTSLFALLDDVATTLRTGGNPISHLADVDTYATNMLTELASVGARENTVDDAVTRLSDSDAYLKGQISGIEDIDLAEVILQLQSQTVAYQAAMGAASKVLTPSLMEFLS